MGRRRKKPRSRKISQPLIPLAPTMFLPEMSMQNSLGNSIFPKEMANATNSKWVCRNNFFKRLSEEVESNGKRSRIDDNDLIQQTPIKKFKNVDSTSSDVSIYYDALETSRVTATPTSELSFRSDSGDSPLPSGRKLVKKYRMKKPMVDLSANSEDDKRKSCGKDQDIGATRRSSKGNGNRRHLRLPTGKINISGGRLTENQRHARRSQPCSDNGDFLELRNSLTSEMSMIKARLTIIERENADLKKIINDRNKALELKMETPVTRPEYIPVPPPPPPPPPLQRVELNSRPFPVCRVKATVKKPDDRRWSITLEDIKGVKLRKTGLRNGASKSPTSDSKAKQFTDLGQLILGHNSVSRRSIPTMKLNHASKFKSTISLPECTNFELFDSSGD